MYDSIHGHKVLHGDAIYLENSLFGIEVTYQGLQNEGLYFLAGSLDQNTQSWKWYAFDDIQQKVRFRKTQKIQGVGRKTAYQIAMVNPQELQEAVENFDIKFFQALPGVGPKTAKRMLVELKDTISNNDIEKLQIDEQLYKDITTSLKSLGYSVQKIKELLPDVPHPLDKEHTADIIKWLIDHL